MSSLLFSYEPCNFYLFFYLFFFYHIMHESSKCDIIKYVTPCTIKVMY